MRHLALIFVLLSNLCFSQSSSPIECREVYFKGVKYCSVSFYEILGGDREYDGVNIRIVGYLKYELDSAVLSVDKVSLEGTMILDNLIGLRGDGEALRSFSEYNGKLVEVYGQYFSKAEYYVLARGELKDIAFIQLKI